MNCNSTKKIFLLQVVHTKAIAALTQFCDFSFVNSYLIFVIFHFFIFFFSFYYILFVISFRCFLFFVIC